MNRFFATQTWVLVILLCALLFHPTPVKATSPPAFTGAQAPYHFRFPQDHGMHPNYRTEWWYFTGHLRARNGRMFGYELTFFRIGLSPGARTLATAESRWRTNQVYPAHFALTDISSSKFYVNEKLERGALDFAHSAVHGLDVKVGGWRAAMSSDGRITLTARADTHAIALRMVSRKPVAIHGQHGVSRKGACVACASHYYSLTRLITQGDVTLDGTPISVSGASWMDHEFSSSQLDSEETGWDWFALMLDDGREIMIYRLRRKDGSVVAQSSATIVAKNGATTPLARDEVQIEALSTWQSPHTHGVYPSEWRITIPRLHFSATVTPALADQELYGSAGTPAYWEGASVISNGGVTLGRAYVELTGYTTPLSY